MRGDLLAALDHLALASTSGAGVHGFRAARAAARDQPVALTSLILSNRTPSFSCRTWATWRAHAKVGVPLRIVTLPSASNTMPPSSFEGRGGLELPMPSPRSLPLLRLSRF
jgi:hypothetical protein